MHRAGRQPRHPRPAPARRGAVLLEVLLSLALLVFGMAVVGLQVRSGLMVAEQSDIAIRAAMLADTKLAELQAAVVRPEGLDEEVKGDFGILYPGYTWRMTIEPTEIEDYYMITLEIGHNPRQIQRQIDDPDYVVDFEDDGRRTVRTVHGLYAKPADIDIERDFGIDITDLEGSLGGGAAGALSGGGAPPDVPGDVGEIGDPQAGGGAGGGGGPGANPQAQLFETVMQFISEHPEILNENGGINLDAIAKMPPEDLTAAMALLQQMVGRNGGLPGMGRGGRGGGREARAERREARRRGRGGETEGESDSGGEGDGGTQGPNNGPTPLRERDGRNRQGGQR